MILQANFSLLITCNKIPKNRKFLGKYSFTTLNIVQSLSEVSALFHLQMSENAHTSDSLSMKFYIAYCWKQYIKNI